MSAEVERPIAAGAEQLRVNGYAPIGAYTPIGDGRTVALVAADGAIDWLTLPTIDSPTVFAAILDAERGGRFSLAPAVPFGASRRYQEHTNVLETTFTTAEGVVRVTDAVTMQDGGLLPWFELARRVEAVSGSVPMRWGVLPRFGYGQDPATLDQRRGTPVLVHERQELAVLSLAAGEPECDEDGPSVAGSFRLSPGESALVVLLATDNEPVPLPPREEIETRFQGTAEGWRRWVRGQTYEGPWKEAVLRSALALKLLLYSPTGAITAAPTTSLPERIGGSRNFDYRFAWIRDASFSLDAFAHLGLREQLHGSLSWLLGASEKNHPRIEVFYGIDGSVPSGEEELPLHGYRGSAPVKLGNGASGQLQLGAYGDLLETVWTYVENGNTLNRETALRIRESADFVCEIWRNEDSGLWELKGKERHYTTSKIGCWVALDRATRLAECGEIHDGDTGRWRREAEAIREFVETRCWWPERRSYRFYADAEALDASVLLTARMGYGDPKGERYLGTIDAVRSELSAGGPMLYRYSGMQEEEGAFVACSFWLIEALALAGRTQEARELMDEMLARANDVGLFSEELDPASGELLGNFPQGLSHLALINAAAIVAQSERSNA